MVTVSSESALVGVKEVRDKAPPKSSILVAVIPLTVTVILPIVLPDGNVAIMLVAVEFVTVAETPLNFTRLFEFMLLNPVPEIVMELSTTPTPGVKEATDKGKTKNSFGLDTVNPCLVTEIDPVVAEGGTMVIILVEVAEVIDAGTPLNLTTFSEAIALNPEPVIVTVLLGNALGTDEEVIPRIENF